MSRVVLVCRDQVRGERSSRRSSRMTGNPIPPMITAAAMGRQMNGSVAKLIRLSLYSANPALLNDETAWNTPWYSARPRLWSWPSHSRSVSTVATTPSTTTLIRATPRMTRRTSPSPSVFDSAAASTRVRRPRRRATRIPSSEAEVIKPNPPAWIPAAITTSPKVDQYDGVSTTTRPVTHTADVAVNSASRNDVSTPRSCDTGSISSSVTMTIIDANPSMTTTPGRRSWLPRNRVTRRQPDTCAVPRPKPARTPEVATRDPSRRYPGRRPCAP